MGAHIELALIVSLVDYSFIVLKETQIVLY